jgi:hypothetical protein
VRVEGVVRIEAAGARRTRQRFCGTVSVALPTVGPLVERLIVSTMRRSYACLPAIVDEWMQARARAPRRQMRAGCGHARLRCAPGQSEGHTAPRLR